MKKNEFHAGCFRDLTGEETHSCYGGSFAYDVGRLIRFLAIAGPNGQWAPAALLDAIATQMQ